MLHARRWAEGLAKTGCEVHFISAASADMQGVTMHTMPIYSSRPVRQLANVLGVRREIRRIQPDVLHVFGLFALSSLGSMLIALGLRPIVSVMGSDIVQGEGTGNRQERFIKKFLLARACRLVSPTRYLACETAKFAPKSTPIDLIASGVDLNLFTMPKAYPLRDEVQIGFAKRLTSASGPDVLLKAFALICEQTNKPVKLLIAGNGPLEQELRNLAYHLGIQDRIQWIGWIEGQEKLRDFFHSIDIFVQPSRRESFGVSAAQASACGLPVVASRFGGIPEVVIDRKTGLLTAAENVEELAQAILSLIHGPGLRSSMGQEGRQWIEASYDWNQCVAKMIKIYHECGELVGSAGQH